MSASDWFFAVVGCATCLAMAPLGFLLVHMLRRGTRS